MTAAVLATVGVLLAVYEWVAVRTGRVPTVTRMVQATPFWIRVVLLTALPTYLWVDHIWLKDWGI
jgi:uncharacterized YccA/Bax inhibitor family protein